ncbi:phytoene desaturase family protein [Microbulbifer rhizosphaerae]|uniref:Pyridine nucleotide-disulfide oxidoreductase domain-containing protein 2 n=1 Tax=Microbulbifer rhizosphaerae TaxID=1562603 RepID=A0A7W4Z949_9GAMM|nr:NAD(P)/FAD-dependent oxidoreductase [Microbulbifer rhizosphaerae]MBB3059860.1 phytoene dehydrogenase-like protein [Microbulbifer rhizosphaerae]
MTDIIIIGGGHNGLVCACYLARAGKQVTVLERRPIVGGAAVTEEFYPGFRNSVASYTVSLLNPKVIEDLRLREHGLQIKLRPQSNFFPLSDMESLSFHRDFADTQAEIARLSPKDAEALPAFYAMLETVADFLREELLRTPPNVGGGLTDLLRAGGFGLRARKLNMAQRRDALDLFTKSAADVLAEWFENDHVRAAFAFDFIVGNYGAPTTPGSAYVLLHHVFGEVNGEKGAWGHAVGGMGAITQAMLKEAQQLGVDVRTDAAVEEVLIAGGRAVGVRLADGEKLSAAKVVSNVGPKLLFSQLVAQQHLSEEFRRRVRGYKVASGTFRMNVALSELPGFTCRPGTDLQRHHQSGIVIGPSMAYLDQAYFDAKQFGWSRKPVVEMLIPSTVDDSLAPPGQHVASLFCQQFSPQLPDGASWDDHREAAADTIIDTIARYAPNFKRSVIARQIHSPLDLERKFGLMGGDIFHGALGLDQLWSNRPFMGYADYRTPVRGLYICGSGTHPGGGVTGVPGHNAAREILKDW